jgi:hypothetical protein
MNNCFQLVFKNLIQFIPGSPFTGKYRRMRINLFGSEGLFSTTRDLDDDSDARILDSMLSM